MHQLVLKNVRVHNLKGVDLALPLNELVVFTGVSGSGKSSLAFDTIYVEGQRRYIESLSHQARRFLGEMPKPDAEKIEGISPTIAIEQKLSGRTPRSTVGTMTAVYDFLRVLFARLATPHCPVSGEPVAARSREKIIAQVQGMREGAKIAILAPYARGKKGEFREDFAELMSKGFVRLRVDGEWFELGEVERLEDAPHDVDIVIDRLQVGGADAKGRIAEAVTTALEIGKGFFSVFADGEESLFSQFAYSAKSGLSYGPLEPHDFSFNHPAGMCPRCQGLGKSAAFDLERIIDPEKSIAEDCCAVASSYETVRYGNIYRNLAQIYDFKITAPWKKLPKKAQEVFLYGTEKKWTPMVFVHPEKKQRWREYVQWRGVLFEAEERLKAAKSEGYRKKMGALMREGVCPDCQGARIRPYPAAARLGGKTIAEVSALTLEEALAWVEGLALDPIERQIGGELIKEVAERVGFLIDVGLSYLSLDRTSPTLSGGEAQRVRLASLVGAGLVGAIYVLDEPSIGLHPVDHGRLIGTLKRLRDQGNTVLVVEHDEETMRAADRIVDVGPGAGSEGGEILSSGTVDDLCASPRSVTGAYLSGRRQIAVPKKRRKVSKGISIRGASHHNLQHVDVEIPLGGLVCVTGVSGSGKSSLISDTLVPALTQALHGGEMGVGKVEKIEGLERIDKIIAVDQTPIGRTPRSNAATYIKLFDEIRDLFTECPESKLRGFHAGHFSFNVKEGSCPYCSGLGQVKIDMDFLEDEWVNCPQCKGRRFDPDILAVRFKGHSIHDVLEMDVEKALLLFDPIPSIRKKLELLAEVGLSYLPIGQPSTTLSGGEAQRIKLAKELVRPATGRTLYVLDEPTTGLHFQDIDRLIGILQKLVDKGNTVLVIEHNMDLVKCADWVIDLGPGPGKFGGRVIGAGTPEAIAKLSSPTGSALAPLLGKRRPVARSSGVEETAGQGGSIEAIRVKGASQNNLKGVDLSIPRGKITVFTGPSGSGKSSMAFETIYAEGQRRYTETLPAYSRQAIKQLAKPKVEQVEGLSPAIALEQKTGGLNPRSTVGTITETYDLVRLFFAHLGEPFCPETGEKIVQISKEFVVDQTLSSAAGEKIHILAPIALPKKETIGELAEWYNRQGFLRVRLNGVYFLLDEPIPYQPQRKNTLHLVVDRCTASEENRLRLFEAVEKAAAIGDNTLVIAIGEKDHYYNLAFGVPSTGKSYPPITPQTFSFNAEAGMCPECQGLGAVYGANLSGRKELARLSIVDIVARLAKELFSSEAEERLSAYFAAQGIDPDLPLSQLAPEQAHLFFNGGPEAELSPRTALRWIGLHPLLAQAARCAVSELRQPLLPLLDTHPCPACGGERLHPLARAVRLAGETVGSFCRLPVNQAFRFASSLPIEKAPFLAEAKAQLVKALQFLQEIGLGYLSLDRAAPTLSGGELQRLRLARQLGSGLTSCLYVLDEPTIGLHPQDNHLLNQALLKLRDLNNTIVLVEHDPMTLEIADWVVDFGPGAGAQGGRITAQGTLSALLEDPHSLTGAYLSGKKTVPLPRKRRPLSFRLHVENGALHNLKQISLSFPVGAITGVTGVSGSGKSTLVRHLLRPAVELALQTEEDTLVYKGARFSGLSAFDKLIVIDQSPIGQTARADVSTYTDIQPLLRSHYASLPLARAKGLQPKHFSPNHKRGMCRTCWGLGYKTVGLQFLPSVRIPCDGCKGFRLNPVSLEVLYHAKHLGHVLDLTIDEARLFFSAIPKVAKKLDLLSTVGLGYLKLGQEIATLSGGEAQRLRLFRELAKRDTGKTLYLIDEPTVGLHFSDIEKLLPIFHRLADHKNTLIIIEHNLTVLAHADYLVELGPQAGAQGGEVIATGTPEELCASPRSQTAPFLQLFLGS
jgi:excinuclease ABC subunit A